MDEIDAALDFKNVSIIANYIKVFKKLIEGTNKEFSIYHYKLEKSYV